MPVNWMKTRAGLFASLPAAWVTFGGIVKTETLFHVTTGNTMPPDALWLWWVIYNTRSEQSARQGGTVRDEVGTNQAG